MFFFPSIIYILILLTSFIPYFTHYMGAYDAPDIAIVAIDAGLAQTGSLPLKLTLYSWSQTDRRWHLLL